MYEMQAQIELKSQILIQYNVLNTGLLQRLWLRDYTHAGLYSYRIQFLHPQPPIPQDKQPY